MRYCKNMRNRTFYTKVYILEKLLLEVKLTDNNIDAYAREILRTPNYGKSFLAGLRDFVYERDMFEKEVATES